MRRLVPAQALSALGLSLALLAAACGDDDQQARTTDDISSSSTTAPPSTGPGDGPDEGSDPVALITLDLHGGFVPVEFSVGDTADLVVLADARVISGAPLAAIYPGPAMLPFQVSQADPAAVEAIVDAIEALDPDADYDGGQQQQVADAATTTVTLHRGDDTVSISAYALDIGDATGPRAELQAVVDQINALPRGAGEQQYEPTALRVHDITELAGPRHAGGDGEPVGRVLDWPVPHDGAECTVVDDPAQVRAALDALGRATQLDRWNTDLGERALVVVPLLPGDEGC